MPCNVCDGDLVEWLEMPIDAKTKKETPHKIARRCKECGLGVIDPLPMATEIPGFYRLDAYYTHGKTHFEQGEPANFFDKARINLAWRVDRGETFSPSAFLKEQRIEPSSVTVLDIGCGHGDTLKQFRKSGAVVCGLDPDPEAVASLKESGIEAYQGAAENPPTPLSGKQFDIVSMSHSLEHCLDPMAALRSAYGLVKKGGVFICETPNCACLHFERFNVISEMYDAPRHLYFFTPENLRLAIESAGFSIVKDYFHGFTRHFANGWRATENAIHDAAYETGAAISQLPPPHTRVESFLLLLTTAFVDRAKKYDCVGYIARKAD